MRRFLLLCAKAGFSFLLLYIALRAVDWSSVGARLEKADGAWLTTIVAILIVQVFLAAIRWREIVERCGATLSLLDATRFNLIGSFFGQTLPSTVGGDAARIVLLGRQIGGWSAATYSVLIDRVVGVTALALLVVVCLPWSLALVRQPIGQLALILVGVGSIGACIVFLAIGQIKSPWLTRRWALSHLIAASKAAGSIAGSLRSGGSVLVLSLVIHLMSVAAAWAAARAVAAPLDLALALFLIPPVILIATIPISIAGWGVRENALIVAFGYAGLPETDGLIVSVLFGAGLFVVGVIGGVVWIVSSGARRALAAPAPDPDP